jgi:hypothetical protein
MKKLDISVIFVYFPRLSVVIDVATTMYKIVVKFWLDLQCLPLSFVITCNCFGVDGMSKNGAVVFTEIVRYKDWKE